MKQIGIDYASVDGNSPPDFVKAKRAGAEFAIIRKSFTLHNPRDNSVGLAVDPHYARDAAHARAAGLTVGSYGFFSFASNAPTATRQVEKLIDGGNGVVRGRDLPYCIDVEFPGRGIVDTGRSQHDAFIFLLEIIAEARRQTGGVSPMLYTSHVMWHDNNGLGGPDDVALDGCPLWVKTPYRLRAGRTVDHVAPRLPHFGAAKDDPHDYWRIPVPWERQGWWLHQYQGDAVGFPGFDMTVDVSQFCGLDATSANETHRIAMIQRLLCVIGEPYRGPLNATGVWDEDTERAVRAFQTTHQLPVTGAVDVATFASLCW